MFKVQILKTAIILFITSIFLAACEEKPTTTIEQQSLTDFLTEDLNSQLRASPEAISVLGMSEEEIGFKTQHLLDDRSPEAEYKSREDFKKSLDTLKTYTRDELSDDEKLYYDIFQTMAENAQPLLDMPGPFNNSYPGIYRLTQRNGPYLSIPQLLQAQHPVNTVQDAEDYIARLNAINENFAGFIEAWNMDIQAGIIPPKFSLEKASATLSVFLGEDPKTNPLYAIFQGKLSALEGVSDEDKMALMASAEAAIESSVKPGYSALKARVDELIPLAPSDAGVWAQPGGDDYYKAAVRIYSGSTLSPEEIHEIGLAEVARITAEMEAIFAQEAVPEGNRRDRLFMLVDKYNLAFSSDDEGRAEVLQYLADNKAFMTENAPDYFSVIPEVDFEVQRVPTFSEATSAGGYYTPPTLGGTRPGIFWINLRNVSQQSVIGLKSLLYHEAVPGHHFELAQAITASDRPIFRRLFFSSNYSEGWALYAEFLALEMGAYENDPVGNLGRLGSELFRAARLVVDTGMHAKKWSREEALTYMAETFEAPPEGFVSEIERYASWPGQALGYKMGMLKIIELRAKAKAAMGEDFDIKAFHQVILGKGSMPMSVIEKRVDSWITQTQNN